MPKIGTFDDWVDLFRQWQKDLNLDLPGLKDYQFEAKFGDLHSPEIEFGDFHGARKWEKTLHIPDQRIRDALLNLIVYQGDTEFASVEQQKNLIETAPTSHDLLSLSRVMTEEMRHGFQMCNLLVNHFGNTGKMEAQKLLERRAFEHNRLLGSFNEDVANWLDFFTYTEFIDRDGKFQLKMLSHSAFEPLARSMPPMLKEESFHLGTGNNGLLRIIRKGRIPIDIIQRYFNKWVPTAYDLFGTDNSSSAHWAYVWGLKGRFNEESAAEPAEKEHLNEAARELYRRELQGLVDRMNKLIPDDRLKLIVPDLKFNRAIGVHADKTYDIYGNKLSAAEYEEYSKKIFPTPEDEARLHRIFDEGDWIEDKEAEKPESGRRQSSVYLHESEQHGKPDMKN
ncbi:MAG TPA: Phenylacetic acid catabolic protein [Acidobacteriota bacterium]|jgi:benzoyl-CoA 2,3-dioxygenase component B|nr:Phenylacetic acid catabolic protein [Acidobacteriota bacterium]